MSKAKPGILIVEDDITSQQYYTVILEDEYDLQVVPTAYHAREALKKGKYQLLIVDISLPGEEDGISLMKFIRKDVDKQIPIFAITAHAFPQNRQDALNAGANEFFTKPILSGILIDALKKHIK
ncbi:MAG: response regulator [Candidatus Marinimicrobia bacterium]|nr:response regulator [Candidatus Neomarinimicrobiota bacterium]